MRRITALMLFLALLLSVIVPVFAEEITEIWTVEDLLSVAENPEGSYILMTDLDMTGISWPSPDFRGTFDGNGHGILNLTLSQPGPSRPESFDGNLISYETAYVGLFGAVEGAHIKDLSLLNVRAVVESEDPVFLAGIAGYFQESTVSGCTVTGTLELRAHDRMFGIGGIAGFGGIGLIENCDVDVTLICVDTDAQTKDEQFLGGVYGTGFVDVKDCNVRIDGYVSEHGYTHNGGIVGMFMQAPHGWKIMGKITGNSVTGKITFFEDNRDRRAYCEPIIGEVLAYSIANQDNTWDFKRDERKEYDIELRPEMCSNPSYDIMDFPAGCSSFGYTESTCTTCGYMDRYNYTLPQHTVTRWTFLREPTAEAEGLETGICDFCGILQERSIAYQETEPTASLEVTQPEVLEPAPAVSKKNYVQYVVITLGAVFMLVLVILLQPKKKKGKFQR